MPEINPLEKGKRFERKVAKIFREFGYDDARRGQQYAGSPDSPDVVHGPDGFHVECKHVERLNLRAAFDKAALESGGKMPVVVHKKNYRPPLATMRFEDWLTLCKEAGR